MIRLRNLQRDDGIILPYQNFSFPTPAADTDLLVAAMDISASVAGASLTLLQGGWLPIPMSLLFTVTDAAGTNLSVTIKIEGWDQFGQPISEKVTSTGAPLVAHTALVYRRVKKATITAIANNAASDTLILGVTSASTSIKYGLPVRPQVKTASGLGTDKNTVQSIYSAGAITSGGTITATPAAFTNISIAANTNVLVVMDLKPPTN
jgi:hypothetical protein